MPPVILSGSSLLSKASHYTSRSCCMCPAICIVSQRSQSIGEYYVLDMSPCPAHLSHLDMPRATHPDPAPGRLKSHSMCRPAREPPVGLEAPCCCTHHTTPNTTLGRLLPLALTLLALLAYSSPSTAGHTFKMPPFINNPLPSSMRSKYCITSLYLRAPPGWMRLAQEAAIRGTSGTCGPMGASYCSGNDMSL